MADLSKLRLPTGTDGALVEYDLKDAGARELISALGDAVYWIGVTTTELTDGATTKPISVNGQDVTQKIGGMAQYSGEEFVWNGSAWQSIGKNNFGSLAFKNSASGDVIAAGTIENGEITVTPGTSSVAPFGSAGTLPAWSVTGEIATFSAGTLPSAGTSVDVVTSITSVEQGTSTFTGTSVTVSVS